MDNTQAPSRRLPDPNNTAVDVRLAAIQEHLDEILRHLDELKALLTMPDRAQPNRPEGTED